MSGCAILAGVVETRSSLDLQVADASRVDKYNRWVYERVWVEGLSNEQE